MSRFDDFAKSSARGGLFRALRGADTEATEAGISRRDLMKNAGIVGGATIAGSTLIQSVASPAFAASCTTGSDQSAMCGGADVTNCPRCPNGFNCTNGSDCANGFCDANGKCATPAPTLLANGATCSGTSTTAKDASCASGYCDSTGKCANAPVNVANGGACHAATQTAANAECGSGSACYSSTTANLAANPGVCKKSLTTVCQNNSECASGICAKLVPASANKTCNAA